MIRNKDTEVELHKYLIKHWHRIFGQGLRLLNSEPAITGFWSGECFGHADFECIRGGQSYLVELKYSGERSVDLWNSLKILGYCAMATQATGRTYKPCVMLKKRVLDNQDVMCMLDKLGIKYISVDKTEDGWFFETGF